MKETNLAVLMECDLPLELLHMSFVTYDFTI